MSALVRPAGVEVDLEVVDLFAGPGGVDEGLRSLGVVDVLGVELDPDACATAEAAGHRRLRTDVAALDPAAFRGADGLWASPPCQAWSAAGKGGGARDRQACHDLLERMAQGVDDLEDYAWADERSALACQPVRWVRELRPRWVALEEVPDVAPLFEHTAQLLRRWGYSVWTGDLNAADYGVPQARVRRVLIGALDRAVTPPPPTHADGGAPPDLFGGSRRPWITAAQALGWTLDDVRAATRPGRYVPSMAYGLDWQTWAYYRPATTICASDRRLAPPAYRQPGQSQFTGSGVVELTVEQAGVLQSFPADYPWQGGKVKAGRQVGNAVPPLLAAHVVAAAAGLPQPAQHDLDDDLEALATSSATGLVA